MTADRLKFIVIDSDIRALKQIETCLASVGTVITSFKYEDTLALVKAEPEATALILSTSKGVDVLGLLGTVRDLNGKLLRCLLTGFEDLTQLVEGLHSGVVQRVLSKPLHPAELLINFRHTTSGTTRSNPQYV